MTFGAGKAWVLSWPRYPPAARQRPQADSWWGEEEPLRTGPSLLSPGTAVQGHRQNSSPSLLHSQLLLPNLGYVPWAYIPQTTLEQATGLSLLMHT